jgi:hypothetical protein
LLSAIVVTSVSSEDEADYKIVVYVFCTNSAANNLKLVLAAVSRASFLSRRSVSQFHGDDFPSNFIGKTI